MLIRSTKINCWQVILILNLNILMLIKARSLIKAAKQSIILNLKVQQNICFMIEYFIH